MNMQVHNLIQGSPQWDKHRASGYYNASDTASVMGCEGAHSTRDQLLRVYKYRIEKEVTEYLQRKYDSGHRFEALALPMAEKVLGDDLYPLVGTRGKFSASFDGLTADWRYGWEHKMLNRVIRGAFLEAEADQSGVLSIGGVSLLVNNYLPDMYVMQMQSQMYVSGAEATYFMASTWSDDNELSEKVECWCVANKGLQKKIVKAWEQFQIDLDAMPELCETTTMPALIGVVEDHDIKEIQLELGGIVVFTKNNLVEVRDSLRAALAVSNTKPETDQDFANARKKIKLAESWEEKCELAEIQLLTKTGDVQKAVELLREMKKDFAKYRIDQSRYVAEQDQAVRANIVITGEQEAVKFIADGFKPVFDAWPIANKFEVPHIAYDFKLCVKHLKTPDSMRNKVGTHLADVRSKVTDLVTLIQGNIKTAVELNRHDLWPDLRSIVTKPADDFLAVLSNRITEANKAEAARKLREEEEARAAEAARIKQAAEIEATNRALLDLATAAAATPQPVKPPTQTIGGAGLGDVSLFGSVGVGSVGVGFGPNHDETDELVEPDGLWPDVANRPIVRDLKADPSPDENWVGIDYPNGPDRTVDTGEPEDFEQWTEQERFEMTDLGRSRTEINEIIPVRARARPMTTTAPEPLSLGALAQELEFNVTEEYLLRIGVEVTKKQMARHAHGGIKLVVRKIIERLVNKHLGGIYEKQ